MKVLTVLGTRPEIIRLSRVIEKLDNLCDHILVHTGQNFDPKLSDIFFDQLRIRQPDLFLGVSGNTFGQQIGKMISSVDEVLHRESPNALLILGDTNSGLCSFIAKRMGIPVFHMEAGNRCYDDRVPEEVNRRIIDHSSTILMPYTYRSQDNLLREGIENNRIYVTGNPIHEIINHFDADIASSDILSQLGLIQGSFFLVTIHRSENVDIEYRIKNLATSLMQVHQRYGYPVVVSLHPRTRQKMELFGIEVDNEQIIFLEPLGFFDFIALERSALCVLSDSGTVQEECCIFRVPTVTLRDVTERPETVDCGSNILSGCEPDVVLRCIETVLSQPTNWQPPTEYLENNVSSKVVKIILGHNALVNYFGKS